MTVLGHTLTEWPESDPRELVLAYNKAHGGADLFRALQHDDSRVSTVEIPIWDHMWALSRIKDASIWRHYMIKLVNRLAYPLILLQAVLYFASLCRDRQVEVLFSHSGGYPEGIMNRAAVLGARMARVQRVCLVVHSLAKRPTLLGLPGAWIHDYALGKSITDLVAVSHACADSLRAHRFVGKDIRVIYSGIPASAPEWYAPLVDQPGKFIVAYIGELSEQKGVSVLLHAIAAIKERVHLVIYGKGDDVYVRRIHDLVESLNIAGHVTFMGFDPQVAAKLASADVVVLPSIAYESFGMVLLEAMRQRKPAVVTDIGGMKEIVVNGRTGFVVRANDAAALSEALQRLAGDCALTKAYGEAGYRRFIEHFTVERMISQYYQLAS